MKTFKAVLTALAVLKPTWFVLENVDLDSDSTSGSAVGSDSESNLSLILQALTDASYNVRAYLLCAQDYGLPQRRTRLYFVGFAKTQEQVNWQRLERNLQKCRLKAQQPAARLDVQSQRFAVLLSAFSIYNNL